MTQDGEDDGGPGHRRALAGAGRPRPGECRSRPSRRSPRGRRSSDCRPTAACRTISRTSPRRRGSTSSASSLGFRICRSSRSARAGTRRRSSRVSRDGCSTTCTRTRRWPAASRPSLRLHAIGLGPVIPYLEADGGRGRDQSRYQGESLDVHVHRRGRGRRLGLRGARGGPQRGLSPPARLERQYVASQPRLQREYGHRRRVLLLPLTAEDAARPRCPRVRTR